ncbi:MAG: nucleotidyltransferase domain-containing protein, partial [Anaerolineae bacterium]|nr:nucleotidyltransferase domain-containing protein [Anaerolineae bacterium]
MDAVLERKQRAADDFLQRLLAGRAREHVAKVILHGSVAQGTAQPDSDIDLLVFGTGEPELVRDAVLNAGLEASGVASESIEPLVYPYGEYRQPSTYFVFNALRKGREMYSMDAAE